MKGETDCEQSADYACVKMESEFLKSATSFVSFLKRSCSCFHVVKNCCEELSSAGFQRLCEKSNWPSSVHPLGKYFITRNESAVIAFAVGGQYKAGNGFSIVAAHTDSPYLKLKPVSKIESNGYCQLGVETYGGGIWSSWLDRDLGLAGRIMVACCEAFSSIGRGRRLHSLEAGADRRVRCRPPLPGHSSSRWRCKEGQCREQGDFPASYYSHEG